MNYNSKRKEGLPDYGISQCLANEVKYQMVSVYKIFLLIQQSQKIQFNPVQNSLH